MDSTSIVVAAGPEPAEPDTAWWRYCLEVLDHLRLPYRLAERPIPGPAEATRLLIYPTPPRLTADELRALDAWVTGGGAVFACGGAGDLAQLAGCAEVGDTGAGHVSFAARGPWPDPPDVAVHAVAGVRLRPGSAEDVLATWDGGDAALTAHAVGAGLVVVIGIDLWQSIVQIQQGLPVHWDGEPAPDGTAPVDDGVLKCDDGIVLCYGADRALPPGQQAPPDGRYRHEYPPAGPVPVFHRPHADLWRWAFLRCLLWAARRAGVALPWLGYWPAGVPAVAHLSHDSDGNRDADAHAALDAFEAADVRVTWCHMFPGGYSERIVDAIAAAGHEQALHYNAMLDTEECRWGLPYLQAQHAWALDLTKARPVTNKNHYTRWEGWHEFYLWCEHLGIQADQSRGSSKQGNVGFPFGTCHVGFPLAGPGAGSRLLDVLAVPLHTQDLGWAAHASVGEMILDEALVHHGVAHFLFHGTNLREHAAVRAACAEVVTAARDRGMPWWTSAEINEWERARRAVDLAVSELPDGSWLVVSRSRKPLPGAALLVALPCLRLADRVDAGPHAMAAVVTRHGVPMVELAVDIPAGSGIWRLWRRPAPS